MKPDIEKTRKYLEELKQQVLPRRQAQTSLALVLGCFALVVAGIGAVIGAVAGCFLLGPLDWWFLGLVVIAISTLAAVSYSLSDAAKTGELSSVQIGLMVAALLMCPLALYALAVSWPEVSESIVSRAKWGAVTFALGLVLGIALNGGYMYLRGQFREPPKDTLPLEICALEVSLGEAPDAAEIAAFQAAINEHLNIPYFDLAAIEMEDIVTVAIGGEAEMKALYGQVTFIDEKEENWVRVICLNKPKE